MGKINQIWGLIWAFLRLDGWKTTKCRIFTSISQCICHELGYNWRYQNNFFSTSIFVPTIHSRAWIRVCRKLAQLHSDFCSDKQRLTQIWVKIWQVESLKVILAKLNILLMAMVKVLLGCSTVKKYKRKKFNLGHW